MGGEKSGENGVRSEATATDSVGICTAFIAGAAAAAAVAAVTALFCPGVKTEKE